MSSRPSTSSLATSITDNLPTTYVWHTYPEPTHVHYMDAYDDVYEPTKAYINMDAPRRRLALWCTVPVRECTLPEHLSANDPKNSREMEDVISVALGGPPGVRGAGIVARNPDGTTTDVSQNIDRMMWERRKKHGDGSQKKGLLAKLARAMRFRRS
ncbi:hypothetical protein CYLTODRAFT_446268 [Cylindrobasidium torrendii FP15055 ss-10]|uniref:Uncharacterized protein n=1 Tax=Cylindrobasidium torrendii FP15055 ss-10 TaxID=1314674 RepID=A0A0D7B077_9AGAR|nr:hypothetical protein CYLTODRAFT_446268 [Cylindrobasidium torrendii FP15055 ss-10]